MNSGLLSNIRGFLFDLDGVFFVGDKVILGGAEVIRLLTKRGFPCRFTTNTTTRSLDTMYRELLAMGLPIEKSEIFSAPQAGVRFLRAPGESIVLLSPQR